MSAAQLISPDYLYLQRELHENPSYGITASAFGSLVAEVIRISGATSVCDYGAGKKLLQGALAAAGVSNIRYSPYDPSFPEYGLAVKSDLVCCIDVLEHIEPDLLSNVLQDLASVTGKLAFISIGLGPAAKTLADGRNAHLIQEQPEWWRGQLLRVYGAVSDLPDFSTAERLVLIAADARCH